MRNLKISILFFLLISSFITGYGQENSFRMDILDHWLNFTEERKIDSICIRYDSIYSKMPPPRFVTQADYNDEYGLDNPPEPNADFQKIRQGSYDSTSLRDRIAYSFIRGYFHIVGPDTLDGIKREVFLGGKRRREYQDTRLAGTIRYSNYKTRETLMIIEVYPELNTGTYVIYYFINNKVCKVKVFYKLSIYGLYGYHDSLRYCSGYLDVGDYYREAVAYYNGKHLSYCWLNSTNGLRLIQEDKNNYYFLIGGSFYFAKSTKWYWTKREMKRFEEALKNEKYYDTK